MTNTPMTSKEAFEKHFKDDFDLTQVQLTGKLGVRYRFTETNSAWKGWQASQAQQAQTIAELVEALDIAKDILEAHTLTHVYDALIAKVKGK